MSSHIVRFFDFINFRISIYQKTRPDLPFSIFLKEVTENLAENSPSIKLSEIIYIIKDGIDV